MIREHKKCEWSEFMKDNTRAAIAYIVGRIITGAESKSVYDYSRSKDMNITGNIIGDSLDFYNNEVGCHISGTGDSRNLALFHKEDNQQIDLKITGTSFDGYDYNRSCHFTGIVYNNSISVYDYETTNYYDYCIND